MQAVIDIGSNSILMLIASRDADGVLEIEQDYARVARLSEGVAARGVLSDAAIERALGVLREYAELLARREVPVSSLRMMATEGLRMAADPERFIEPAQAVMGVPLELLSGDEEARLSYLSVAREVPAQAPLRVLDIGGASTELIAGRGETIEDAVSHRIGSVRLTEMHVADPKAPVSAKEIAAIEATAREALAAQPLEPHPELHGLAGTVTTGAALLLGLDVYERERVDGARFARDEIRALRDRLAAMDFAQRAAFAVLGEKRADVVVAGLSILSCILEHSGAETLVVRDRGLRYALIQRPAR